VSEVFTLTEAAAYLRLPEQDVVRMIHEQGLPARQLGSEWRLLKTPIQHWLATGSQPLKGSKEAWLSLAGSCKDDPDLEAIVDEDGSYKNFSR
jgi:excisionase family DNA binding protein